MMNKDLVSLRYNQLKHFDMTTMGYYAHMEWENYDELAHNFNNITYCTFIHKFSFHFCKFFPRRYFFSFVNVRRINLLIF